MHTIIQFKLDYEREREMNSGHLEKCCQCFELFTEKNEARQLPSCQHCICTRCLQQVIQTKQDGISCYFCSNELQRKDIFLFPTRKGTGAKGGAAGAGGGTTGITGGMTRMYSISNEIFAGEMLLAPQSSITEDTLCPLHDKPLDIICISDKEKICPHCAIFGNHKDHRFKTIKQFQLEVEEKSKVFAQIKSVKDSLQASVGVSINTTTPDIQAMINTAKAAALQQLQLQFSQLINRVNQVKQEAIRRINTQFDNIMGMTVGEGDKDKSKSKSKGKTKLQKWQQQCRQIITVLQRSPKIQDKIVVFYDSPLEIVSEGLIYIEEMQQEGEESVKKANQAIKQLQLTYDRSLLKDIQRFISINTKKEQEDNIKIDIKYVKEKDIEIDDKQKEMGKETTKDKTKIEDEPQDADSNPFLQNLQMYSSLHLKFQQPQPQSQLDESKLSISNRITSKDQVKTAKKVPHKSQEEISMPMKSVKSMTNLTGSITGNPPPRVVTVSSPNKQIKVTAQQKIPPLKSKVSPRNFKSPTKQLLPPPTTSTSSKTTTVKQPEKILKEFSKNYLTDIFDISECNLESDRVVDFVHRARKIHKIKGLKLASNRLNSEGFQRMLDYLQGVSNINLSSNQINESIFDIILKNKEKLQSLRILNLSNNYVNLDKKVLSAKLQQLKKTGVIVVL